MIDRVKEKRITFSEIAKELNETLAQADPLRTAGLQRLQKIRTARPSGQQRERERLSRVLGPEHPRVAVLSEKAEADRDLIRETGINIDRAQIETPEVDEHTWVVHGLVYSSTSLEGVSSLTVGLYDQKGKWLEQFGYVCTDKTGYFKLSYRFEKGAEKPMESAKGGSASAAKEHCLQAFIRLQGRTGIQVFIDTQPVRLEAGKDDYREILLGEETEVCSPPVPPDQARP